MPLPKNIPLPPPTILTTTRSTRNLEQKFADNGGGYLYLMFSWEGIFKIGIAFDPVKRLNKLRRKYGEMCLIGYAFFSDPRQWEKQWHTAFRLRVHNGEWFHLVYNDVTAVQRFLECKEEEMLVSISTFEAAHVDTMTLVFPQKTIIADRMNQTLLVTLDKD